MKLTITTLLSILLLGLNSSAQIQDIKQKSTNNSSGTSSSGSSSSSSFSDSDDLSGCSDLGDMCCLYVIDPVVDFLIITPFSNYWDFLLKRKPKDPSILSLDINANLAAGAHLTKDQNYTYFNFLPGLRANLLAFIIDFRYNILTEFTDGYPDSFKSWHLDLAFNIAPVETFKLALGLGVHAEMYSDSYFPEYFAISKIGLAQNIDYIELNFRLSNDIETKAKPFLEAGAKYNKQIIDFKHISGYISSGITYQNYYLSHEIWLLQAGVAFNWH